MTRSQKNNLTEAEIDDIVVAESDEEAAWEQPIVVHKAQSISVSLPSNLLFRAQFLANLHREPDLADWLARIIRERIELEETAYREVKSEFATTASASVS
jgi:hypothetical protein